MAKWPLMPRKDRQEQLPEGEEGPFLVMRCSSASCPVAVRSILKEGGLLRHHTGCIFLYVTTLGPQFQVSKR